MREMPTTSTGSVVRAVGRSSRWWRSAGLVRYLAPEESLITGSRNKDRYVNMKAQVYEALARRLELTHRVVQAKERGEPAPPYVADDLISFGADLPEKNRLLRS